MTRTYQPLSECQRCRGPMPATATTGRRRVYCRPACRKAAYEERRAKKPGAVQVKLVDRVIIETSAVKAHRIADCFEEVIASPRAVANVLEELTDLARNRRLVDDPKWARALRAIDDLNGAIAHAIRHDRRGW